MGRGEAVSVHLVNGHVKIVHKNMNTPTKTQQGGDVHQRGVIRLRSPLLNLAHVELVRDGGYEPLEQGRM